MPTVSSDTDLALPPIPGSESGVRQKPRRSAPPLPRASLPPLRERKSTWDDADDAATVKEAPRRAAGRSAPPPPRLPLGSLPPKAALGKVELVGKRVASRRPLAPSPAKRRLPPAPANQTIELDIPALSPVSPRRSVPPPTPPGAKKAASPPRSSLPPAPPAASVPSPQPAPAPQAVKKIGSEVQTLLGVVAPPAERPVGRNPFGPETMEFDLAPYLRKVPVDVSPRALVVAIVLVAFVLGSALAVAATGGEDAEPPVTRIETPAAPVEAPAAERDEPAPQPRLVDLMPEPESDEDRDVRSARAAIDPDPQPAVSDREARIEAIRARRQARRRARIRARWIRNHGGSP